MSAGLFGLLDDVAVLARLAAATGRTTAKAAGVVIDDTAVTPQYVHGIAAERELPIIKRIAIGSLRNKLLLILPAAMLLSQFAPWLVTRGCVVAWRSRRTWRKAAPFGAQTHLWRFPV